MCRTQGSTCTEAPPSPPQAALNLIYDSKCGVCQWEIDFLRARDTEGRLTYTDLEAPDFEENVARNGFLDYETALSSFHAVRADGTLLRGMPVFREAYSAVGLGWVRSLQAPWAISHPRSPMVSPPLPCQQVWAVYDIPVMAKLLDFGYSVFARYRTDITRGSSLEALFAARRAARAGDCEPCRKAAVEGQ